MMIGIGIFFFVASKLFFIGALLAISGLIAWLCVPVGKFLHYLVTSPELSRVRPRAMLSTVMLTAAVLGPLGLIPVPDHGRAQGIVEPAQFVKLHVGTTGFMQSASGVVQRTGPEGQPVVVAENVELLNERQRYAADQRLLDARYHLAMSEEKYAEAQSVQAELRPVRAHVDQLNERISKLAVRSPFDGIWIPKRVDEQWGAYVKRGTPVGWVAGDGAPVVRVVAGQYLGPRLLSEIKPGDDVAVRAIGCPDPTWTGHVVAIVPAGRRRLPAASLAKPAGGAIAIKPGSAKHRGAAPEAAESFFEIQVRLPEDALTLRAPGEQADAPRLHPRQRVEVRFDLSPKPVLTQGWRWLRQLVQRRLQI